MRIAQLVTARCRRPAGVDAWRPPRPEKHFGAGGRFFRYRNALGIGLAVLLLVFPWGRIEAAAWSVALGLTLTLSGAALRIWAILQIGGAARKTSSLKAVRVISWGPFAMVRNPIYIANIAVFCGFTVLSRLLWALPLVVLALGSWYHRLVRREERFLEETFGEEYREYMASTGRWLPSLRFRSRPAAVPAYPILRALRRERGHLAIVAVGILSFVFLPAFSESALRRLEERQPSTSTERRILLDVPSKKLEQPEGG